MKILSMKIIVQVKFDEDLLCTNLSSQQQQKLTASSNLICLPFQQQQQYRLRNSFRGFDTFPQPPWVAVAYIKNVKK